MKTYTTLITYLLIFFLSGIAFIFTLDKYFDIQTFTVKKTAKDFDILVIIGLLLAFFNALKELIQMIPILKNEFKDKFKEFILAKRKEGKFEIEVDDYDVNEKLWITEFEHNFIEGKKRSIGDNEIGRIYFSDIIQEFRLNGKNVSRNNISYVIFYCYSEFPLPNVDIEKYIKICCNCNIENIPLNFKIKKLKDSLHKFDIYVYFSKPISRKVVFDLTCSVTIPYTIFSTGFDCLFSNSSFKKIDKHKVKLVFKQNSPNFVTVKELSNKDSIETLLKPVHQDNDNVIFQFESFNKQNISKIQIEFERK